MWYFQGKIAGVALIIGLFALSANEYVVAIPFLLFGLFAIFGKSWANIGKK